MLTQEDSCFKNMEVLKKRVNAALRHSVVLGLAVLDSGLELMTLKGLFLFKSMNFCEIPWY